MQLINTKLNLFLVRPIKRENEKQGNMCSLMGTIRCLKIVFVILTDLFFSLGSLAPYPAPIFGHMLILCDESVIKSQPTIFAQTNTPLLFEVRQTLQSPISLPANSWIQKPIISYMGGAILR